MNKHLRSRSFAYITPKKERSMVDGEVSSDEEKQIELKDEYSSFTNSKSRYIPNESPYNSK